jgi:double-stranded uracil-DNA glycosylase
MPPRRKSPLPDASSAVPPGAGYVESFAPAIGVQCRVLVLGSMPGVKSLEAGQYYAHPQNLFWPLMEVVFGVPATLPYTQRLAQLLQAGVGLWDVLRGCKRSGSLDSAIDPHSEVPNRIAELLEQRPDIRALAFNGAKAAQAFRRHVAADIAASRLRTLALLAMPSTSPAHASMDHVRKAARWSVLRELMPAPRLRG